MPAVLTIAGSDSGGGAGIQADLKTFAALEVFGTSAITCVTAQNPTQVSRVYAIDAHMVAEQIMMVCAGFSLSAAKTGMLYAEPIIRAVAQCVSQYRIPNLVVDPVMMSTSRAQLLRPDSVSTLCWEIMTKALVVTPNLVEAEVLFGSPIPNTEAAKAAARDIAERFKTACLVKGGHLKSEVGGRKSEVGSRPASPLSPQATPRRGKSEVGCQKLAPRRAGSEVGDKKSGKASGRRSGGDVVDVLYWQGKILEFRCPRVDTTETHGTGCTHSAALTAFLAKGDPLPKAIEKAQRFVHDALKNAVAVGKHHTLGW